MGCCAYLKNDIFTDKELIMNLNRKELEEIEDFIERNRDDSKNTQEKKYRKSSSKTVETNAKSPKKAQKVKKSLNFYNHRIKDVANSLRQFAIDEVKNIPTYFVLK